MILNTRTHYPQARSYVLRLHPNSAPRLGRIVGRIDHVVTGRRFHFASIEELVARLAECDAADERREGGA
jgi:hypothetical protein